MKQPSTQASVVLVITAFAIVYIVWGSTYFFIQAAERGFQPFLLGCLRFSASGILLLLWCAVTGKKLFISKQITSAFIAGNLLLFIANGSLIWSEEYLPSSFVAVLTSATPLWIILLDGENRRFNFSNKKIMTGIFTGFAGVVLLFSEKVITGFKAANVTFMIFVLVIVVAGNVSWAAGSLYSKKRSTGDIMVTAAWQMIAAAFSFFLVTCFSGEVHHINWQQVPLNAWLSVLYLVTMGSLAGYSAFIWLLSVRPATQVTTNAYVNPVVAVLLGVFFGGEMISALQLFALFIILSSVFIINADKYKKNKLAD